MKMILLVFTLFYVSVHAQDIPCGAKTIAVPNIGFKQVCMALLDSGFVLDRKDADLQTVSTMPRAFPKRFSATYVINIRVKDSTTYFTVTFSAPSDGSIVRNEPSIYKCKKSGKPIDNVFSYPFLLLNSFVKGFGKGQEYLH